MDKLVSVIMSTKDTPEDYLTKAIMSILNQTYKNIEFIIICDGSETNYATLKKISDNRIKIIKHDKSQGLTKSLNEAIRMSTGDYIARMDSDDISLKYRIETQVRFLEKNPDIDICSTLFKQFGDIDNTVITLYNNPDGIKSELFLDNRLAHPSVMIRKSFLDKNNILYDENFKYAQDYELWSRACHITKIAIVPKLCLLYRVHNKQIGYEKKNEQLELCKKIITRNLKHLEIDINDKTIDNILFLSRKQPKKIEKKDIESFIKLLLDNNKNLKIYNNRLFKTVLYYNYTIASLIINKRIPNIKYIIKGHFILFQIRKRFLKIKYKF